jgi:hypothetical protein
MNAIVVLFSLSKQLISSLVLFSITLSYSHKHKTVSLQLLLTGRVECWIIRLRSFRFFEANNKFFSGFFFFLFFFVKFLPSFLDFLFFFVLTMTFFFDTGNARLHFHALSDGWMELKNPPPPFHSLILFELKTAKNIKNPSISFLFYFFKTEIQMSWIRIFDVSFSSDIFI